MATSPEERRLQPIRGPLRTPSQVARRLGISRDTVIRLYDTGALVGADFTPIAAATARRRRAAKRMIRFRDDDVERFEELRFRAPK